MKKIITISLLTAVLVLKAYACGNEYYSFNYKGERIRLEDDHMYPHFDKNFDLELNVSKIENLIVKAKKDKNYMLLSDYALCLLKLGKRKEPVEILAQLYKYYPNDYKIAANLGTAYELDGQVDSALKYIRRDLVLNPNDHHGSEWIHVKVLETKLELRKNPDYLKEHSVLNLTEKQKNDPTVFKHLRLQLKERVPFSPEGKDEIMASLFTDLGDISSNIKSIAYARAYYLIAQQYYGGDSPSLETNIKELEKLIDKYTIQDNKAKRDSTYKRLKNESENLVAYVKYQGLLKNENLQNYKVNWEKINTDVTALLALVDITKTTEQIIATENAKPNDSAEALKLIPEHDHAEASVIDKTASNNTWIYIAAGLTALVVVGYFVWGRSRKS